MRLPWLRVAVAGASMRPTLEDGDWLMMRTVRDGRQVRAGQILLLERPDRPGLVIIKRAVRRTADGWWVEGDNAEASDDSRCFGVVPDRFVRAWALARYHPSPRWFGR